MELLNIGKKFLKTFTLNSKQKLLNTLLYDGDDMFEEKEEYERLFEILKQEQMEGTDKKEGSMVNLILNILTDFSGSSNYVFKIISLIIKITENFKGNLDILLPFYDNIPIPLLEKNMEDYKFSIKKRVASMSAKILSNHLKLLMMSQGQETTFQKVRRLTQAVKHSDVIFTEGLKVVEMLEAVAECGSLIDNEGFITAYMFSIQQTITAYQTILDYTSMIASFSTIEYSLPDLNDMDSWNDMINSLERVDQEACNFLLKLTTYNYFTKDYKIQEEDFLDNEKQYGRKRAKQILSEHPYCSLDLVPYQEDVEDLDLPDLDESIKEETKEHMVYTTNS